MKKATRRLLVAIFALCVAVAVSVGATFAWFTTSDTAEIAGISGQVTSGDASLEIKLVNSDGTEIAGHDWGYSLDLTNDIAALTKLKFDAVSYKNEEMQIKTETAAKKVTIGNAEDATNEGQYVDFYLAMRSVGKLDVYLGAASKVEENGENKDKGPIYGWDELADSVYGTAMRKGAPIDAKAENAVRVGFQAVNDASSWEEPVKAGVWAPNEAELNGKPVDKDTGANTSGHGKGFWKGNLAQDYETRVSGDGVYTYPAYTGIDCKGKDDAGSLVVQLSELSGSYYMAYLHVAIWLEGTDGDCMNNIFNDKFKVNLELVAKVNTGAVPGG